ncbi:MAG: hypothetical protein Q8R42_05385, partial [Desulfocapsaceae bacterium]|nr:hypothetical protein [Desulfocapsaceae bacterium]
SKVVFLLGVFTASYAASRNQQSVWLVESAASGRYATNDHARRRYKLSKVVFLLGVFTASYAASRNQQSVWLVESAASGQ